MSRDRKPIVVHSGHVRHVDQILAAQAELPIIIAAGNFHDRNEDHNPFDHAIRDRFIHIQYECNDLFSREAAEEFRRGFYPEAVIDEEAGLTEWQKRAKKSRDAKAALVAKLKGKRK